MMTTISSSNGVTLVFADEEMLKEYADNLEVLQVETYKKIRDRYGIFAGNQNVYVDDRDKMNDADPKYMENLYDKYYDTE